jgi:acetyl-CoA carboxylase, biotin carboxylase subunit
VPTIPGTEQAVSRGDDVAAVAQRVGYPLMIKASFGGGGRGMRVVNGADELDAKLAEAQREAGAAFGRPDVFLERYIPRAKHIEVQILGDAHGNLVHLWERDCSVQRRHQKVVELAPSINLPQGLRERICEAAVRLCRSVGYRSAGTVEFLLDVDRQEFFFIEVNPRIQVEHTVTEMVTGVDLVREQIRIADGRPLSVTQDDIDIKGHAIECRINAEDPQTFAPSPGLVTAYHAAGGMHVRVDSGLYAGYRIPPYYDSMIAKLIVYGRTREGCIMRLRRALEEMVVEGVKTSIPLHQSLLQEPDILSGDYSINWLEDWMPRREA